MFLPHLVSKREERVPVSVCPTTLGVSGSGVISILQSLALLPSDLASKQRDVSKPTGVGEEKKKKEEK